MSDEHPQDIATPKLPVSPPTAVFLGWLAVALTNAVFIEAAVPWPPAGGGTRALHHFYDAGHLFALGALSTLLVLGWARVRPRFAKRGIVSAILISLISIGVGSIILFTDLDNLASRLALKLHLTGIVWPTIFLNALIIVTALGITLAWAVGRLFARPILRWVAVAAGIGAAVANQIILRNDYEGAHFYLGWAAATVIAAALAGALSPTPRLAMGRARLVVLGAALVWGIAAVLTRPTTNVLLQLYTTPGSAVAPFLARFRGRSIPAHLTAGVSPEQAPWFTNRDNAPDVPPTPPIAQAPVVIFLGIDSVRADVLADPNYLAQLPTLARLKATGVYFSQARSPGPGTVFTYSALFSSRYFSQMYWSPKSGGIWPWEDTSPRFPEILSQHDVATVDIASILWFTNGWGVTKGFTEETNMDARASESHSTAKELVDAIIPRLTQQGPEPLFLFTHFMDAHFPYDQGSKTGAPKDRFVSELAIVDGEIGRLKRVIDRLPIASRTTLIITADHGEAFGEHHTTQHGTTVYEELLRVPLLFSAPRLVAREVTEPVSLIDIAPTVLDLFGAPTPGTFMGQSLVPFLHGETPVLTRPILAEGRLKRSLVFRDGYKVITDERRGTVELYDLNVDPGELHNLAAEGATEAEARVGAIDAFFQAHTLKKPGYTPPYRP